MGLPAPLLRCQQRFANPIVAGRCERSRALFVPAERIGAAGEEQKDNTLLAAIHRPTTRSLAVTIPSFEFCAGIQQHLRDSYGAPTRRHVQWCGLAHPGPSIDVVTGDNGPPSRKPLRRESPHAVIYLRFTTQHSLLDLNARFQSELLMILPGGSVRSHS